MLVSGEEGIIKPDPAIYLLMCERFDLSPDRTFFVDDSAANVDAARAWGSSSHRFVDAAGAPSRPGRCGRPHWSAIPVGLTGDWAGADHPTGLS